jgi:hypothetical protein
LVLLRLLALLLLVVLQQVVHLLLLVVRLVGLLPRVVWVVRLYLEVQIFLLLEGVQ